MPRLRATGVVYPLPPLLMRGSPWHKAVRLRCLGVDTSDDRLAVTVVERGNVRHNPGLSKGSSSVLTPQSGIRDTPVRPHGAQPHAARGTGASVTFH